MDRLLRHSTFPVYSHYFLSTFIVVRCRELIVAADLQGSGIKGWYELYVQGKI